MTAGSDVWVAAASAPIEQKAKLVLLTVASEAGLLDDVAISERQLARATGLSRSVVWDRLRVLERLGWLQAQRVPGSSTVWAPQIPVTGGRVP